MRLAGLLLPLALTGCGSAGGPVATDGKAQEKTPRAEDAADPGHAVARARPPIERKKFETDADVDLRFLARWQTQDGGFVGGARPRASRGDVGLTGATLFAYTALGYSNRGTHGHAKVVGKAARFLRKAQRPDGRFASRIEDHAVAAAAMLRLYLVTGSVVHRRGVVPALRALAEACRQGLVVSDEAAGWTLLALADARAWNHYDRGRDGAWQLEIREDAFDVLRGWQGHDARGRAVAALAELLVPVSTASIQERLKAVTPALLRERFVWDGHGGSSDVLAFVFAAQVLRHAPRKVRGPWEQALVKTLAAPPRPTALGRFDTAQIRGFDGGPARLAAYCATLHDMVDYLCSYSTRGNVLPKWERPGPE